MNSSKATTPTIRFSIAPSHLLAEADIEPSDYEERHHYSDKH
jgi:hypothetical protein